MIIIKILELYAIVGLLFMLAYMYDVGQMISKKYGCGLMEGISRFEKAGSLISNMKAVVYCIIIWPKMYVAMKRGAWYASIQKMVDENDY